MGEESSLARARRELATAAPYVRRAVRKNRGLVALVIVAGLVSFGAPPLAAHVLPGISVVVADRNFSPGETIEVGDLTTAKVRPDLVPEGAARSSREVMGKSTAGSIQKGALVLREHLREAESALGTERALVSIPISASSVVDGAEPGTQLRVYCERPSNSEDVAQAPKLNEVRAVLREPRVPEGGGVAPFATSGTAMATIEIERAQVSTIAHCTLDAPPFIAVVG
ncbi:SAF domain-containing protein [Dermabacter sp. p3-SID358]|uniref:SAF domain-containing protein n=1 Tax=Dermabacter sp. p3-SID358 TaxID=2916114 RepID=UPI0021A2C20E|nr:SAF domain-containing protein [Dermabacter sp. p3-SID358]MCT1867544.1 SAF domain-containing protein [Dermabacter sp. p3-SID358]